MHVESIQSASAGFRHLTRTLSAGEVVPRAPSLFEQLSACARGKLAADLPDGFDETQVETTVESADTDADDE